MAWLWQTAPGLHDWYSARLGAMLRVGKGRHLRKDKAMQAHARLSGRALCYNTTPSMLLMRISNGVPWTSA